MGDDDIELDTITITNGATSYSSPYTYNMASTSIGTITINSAGTGYSTVTGATGSYLTSNGSYNTWATSPSPAITTTNIGSTPGIQVKGDAEFDGDVKIKGRSIVTSLDEIEKRLAILVPDPKKLEKFEALKKAYNHYKMLEALCMDEDNEQPT